MTGKVGPVSWIDVHPGKMESRRGRITSAFMPGAADTSSFGCEARAPAWGSTALLFRPCAEVLGEFEAAR